MSRHLTVAQASRLLHRAPKTVRGWIAAGDLPGTQRVRDGYRIPLASIRLLVDTETMSNPGTPLDTAQFPHGYADSDAGAHADAPAAEPAMPLDLSTYLTLAEAAERMKRSTRTIRRWVAQGELPNALRIKQRILVAPADLDQLYQPACPA